MESILVAKKINKSFNKGNVPLHILKDINFNLKENSITAIIGASGAGKSTLLNILAGLDEPDSGEIIIEGKDITKLSDEKLSAYRNESFGFVFQFHHLLPEFTALENTYLPLMIREGSNKKYVVDKAKEILYNLGLEDRLHHKPAELSGGEQQRVSIARALINEPKIIFADEPTGNLDSENGKVINDLFLKIRNDYKTTILFVSHNPELIKISDITYEIKDGILRKQ